MRRDRYLFKVQRLISLCVGLAVLLSSCTSSPLRKGDRYAADGQWDQAVASYREAYKKDPFNERVQAQLDIAKAHAAEEHYVEGRRGLEQNRLHDALREFKLAVGLDPSKAEHHAGMNEALRLKEARDLLQAAEKLQNLGRTEEALSAYERAVELDHTLTQALEAITGITKQQRAVKQIGTSTLPVSLRFQNAKLKEVFEVLARSAGVNIIFDKEVHDDPVTIFIKDLPFDEALNLILNTNGMIAQRIAPETLLIMPNSKQKQAQYQDQLMRTFYLANAKAKDAGNLLRTMLESKRIHVDEKVNAIFIRDEPARLQLAERLLFALDRHEPEVELDLELLEVNRTKSLKYGLNYAKQAGFGIVPPGGSGGISTSPTQFTYQQLTSIGPESYLFTLPASVLIDFFKQESDAKTLASPKIRVVNNKSASINIGDKQPILLSTTNVLPGQAATGAVPTTSTVTSIEFKDTGIKLTVEPSVNLMDEVTLKVKVEVTRLGDQVTLQASPEIKQFRFGTRSAETVLMLKDDETVVLAGLIQDEDRKTRSTVPLLGDIPWIGQLFSSTTIDRISSEVVLTITPRIVRSLTTPPLANQAFWSGTESNYATTQLFVPHAMKVAKSTNSATDAAVTAAKNQTGNQATHVPEPSPVPQPPAMTAPVQPVVPGRPQATMPSDPQADLPPTQSLPPELVARGLGAFALRPRDLAANVGQEVRLDLTTAQLDSFTESLVTVGYDSKRLEFRRVGPGMAAISAHAADGQVTLTMRRQGTGGAGEGVLAMLFFLPKAKGDAPVTLQISENGGVAGSSGGSSGQAIIHVR